MPADGFSPVTNSPDQTPIASQERPPCRVIVVGNEKGGAGKSTVAMHLSVSLMRMGCRIGVIDLDVRQRTLTRYLENRMRWIQSTGSRLPMPEIVRVDASDQRDLDAAEREESDRFHTALKRLQAVSDFVVIDAPGGDTYLSRQAHVVADTLITPMNDSFVDFDLLGDVNPQTLEVLRPSFYSEMVWNCRKQKAMETRKQIDWIVMRNRISPLDARNKQQVGEALLNLSKRIGFRLASGLSERGTHR